MASEIGEWFEFDIHASDKDNRKELAWFRRLAHVATTVLVQWIKIHLGFSQPGGITYEPSLNTCRLLLLHVPTEGEGDNLPVFTIADESIRSLVQIEEKTSKNPTQNDIRLKEIEQDIYDTAELPESLPPAALNQVVNMNDSETLQVADSFKDAIDHMPTNPLEGYSTGDKAALANVDPFRLPPAKLYANELTPTDYAFITGNTRAKVAIAIALAKQEMEGWRMLASQCQAHVNDWTAKLQELEFHRNLLHQSQTGSLQFHEYMHATAAKVDEAQEEVGVAMNNPLIAKQIKKMGKGDNPPGSPSSLSAVSRAMSVQPGTHSPLVYSTKTDTSYISFYCGI